MKNIPKMMLFFSLFFFLISCSSNPYKLNKANPVSLTIWHHYIGAQKTAFDNLISQFNNTEGRDQGIAITAISMDNTGDISDKLLQAAKKEIGAPPMPDIATAYPSTAYTLNQMNMLTKIDQYFTPNELKTYVDSFLQEGYVTDNSGLLIFPIAKSTEVLFVNNTAYQSFLTAYNAKNPDSPLSENMLSTFEGIEKTAECYFNWTGTNTATVKNGGKALFGFDAVSNFAIIGYHQLGFDFSGVSEFPGILLILAMIISIRSGITITSLWSRGTMVRLVYTVHKIPRQGDLIMYAGSTAGATFFPKTVVFENNTKYDADSKSFTLSSFCGWQKSGCSAGSRHDLALLNRHRRRNMRQLFF